MISLRNIRSWLVIEWKVKSIVISMGTSLVRTPGYMMGPFAASAGGMNVQSPLGLRALLDSRHNTYWSSI